MDPYKLKLLNQATVAGGVKAGALFARAAKRLGLTEDEAEDFLREPFSKSEIDDGADIITLLAKDELDTIFDVLKDRG